MLRIVLLAIAALGFAACSHVDGTLSPEERASYGDGATLEHTLTAADWFPQGTPIVIAQPSQRWGAHPNAHDISEDIVPAPALLTFRVSQARIGQRVQVRGSYRYSDPDLTVWSAWRARGNYRVRVRGFPRPIQIESIRGRPDSYDAVAVCRVRVETARWPEPVYRYCQFN